MTEEREQEGGNTPRLVERLREEARLLHNCDPLLVGDGELVKESADRIEALERELSAEKAARAEVEKSLPTCAEHKSRGGARSGCVVCATITLSAALSRIDYTCGEPNDQQMSAYDVHCDEEAVIANVEALRVRAASASQSSRRQIAEARRYRWLRERSYIAVVDGKYIGWAIRPVPGYENSFDVAIEALIPAEVEGQP